MEVKGFVSTGSGEDMLVRDVCKLLVELGKVNEADGLVELVTNLDNQVTAFEDMLEDRDIRIDDLEEELERKVDRIDFLENELVEVRSELELRLWRAVVSNWELREVLFDEDGNPIAHREHIKPTGTIKIAINTIYGGFALSRLAEDRYKELTGEEIDLYNIQRDDKALIQAIEEFGELAGGAYTAIRIVEVPEDTNWAILDFDGLEIVVDEDRVWRGHD